jgi:hypothetical protein
MNYETEEKMNRLIEDLCTARAEEAAAFNNANSLAMAAPQPYSEEKMREFCEAGDRMQSAQARKWLALDRVRDSYRLLGTSGSISSGPAPQNDARLVLASL